MPDIITLSKALDGRHVAARGDRRERARLRGVSFRRLRPRADARADVSPAIRSRARLRTRRSICSRRSRACGKSRRSSAARSAGSPRAARSTACATCASRARSASCSLTRAPQLEALRARFVRHGVWVRPFGDVVYLMPPLVIGSQDLERLDRRDPRRAARGRGGRGAVEPGGLSAAGSGSAAS